MESAQLSSASESTGTAPKPETDSKPPIADAGPDKVIYEGGETTLDGTSSMDEDGTIKHYSWILEDTDDDCDPVTGSLQDTHEAKTKFSAPKEIPQQECNYYYELEVRDNNGLIDSDGVIVKVQSADTATVNKPPIAHAGKDRQIHEGDTITLDGTGSTDEDGNIVSYKWNIEEWDDEDPSGKLSKSNSIITKFTAPILKEPPGVYGIDLTVEDNDGAMDVDTIIVHVTAKPVQTLSQGHKASTAGEDVKRVLSNKSNSESKLPIYVERTFQLSPFILSCHYNNQTSELMSCNVVCCTQSNNITTFAQGNTSSISQERLLGHLLNHSLVFLNETNIVGKIVPLNETETAISPNTTSLLPLLKN